MILIDAAELPSSSTEVPSQFTFRGKHYICRQQYAKPNLAKAIAECRKQLDEGLFCMIVEGATRIGLCLASDRQREARGGDRSKSTPSPARPAPSPIAAQLVQKYAAGARNFRRLDLRNQNLVGLDLSGTNFSHANFAGAKLDGTKLVRANLNHANLSNANLLNTDLSNANLSNVNLSGANLAGTKFTGARLRGAIMPDGTT